MKARAGCSNSLLIRASSWCYQPSKQRPQPAQHGRLALCLPSTNLERSLEQALTQGASALEAIRQESFGREVWIEDPEGNRLLLLEWAQ